MQQGESKKALELFSRSPELMRNGRQILWNCMTIFAKFNICYQTGKIHTNGDLVKFLWAHHTGRGRSRVIRYLQKLSEGPTSLAVRSCQAFP